MNLLDYTGGLNLRRSQFQLAENESPDMLNVDVDPRGGFYTRQGWRRWNVDEIVEDVAWHPINAFVHDLSSGEQETYVVRESGEIYVGDDTGAFIELTTLPDADTPICGVDGIAWGDTAYVTFGSSVSYRRTTPGAPAALDPDNWSEIDAPTAGVFPQAKFCETHAGYAWVAATVETAVEYPNRIRWSHPGVPDSWRVDDYMDLDLGGGRVTGLLSFSDHLLVFKSSGIFAIFGYDDDSWQVVQVSSHIGALSPTHITKSSRGAFFYSPYEGGGIFVYTGNGEPQLLSEALTPAFEEMHSPEYIFVSWAGSRLWVSVPWHVETGERASPTSLFVYDPDIGNGAWTMYRSDYGAVTVVLDGADTNGRYPLAAFWSDATSAMVTLDHNDEAYDELLLAQSLGADPGSDPLDLPDYLVTGLDDELLIGGETFQGEEFETYYRTRWLHANFPDRKKSWRRPTFICREVPQDVDLLIEVYKDYNETRLYRSRTLSLSTDGAAFWSELGADSLDVPGFDWSELGEADPRGADWGSAERGSRLVRSGSMGSARAIQMKVGVQSNSLRRRWGVDGIVAKIVMRRLT